MQELKVRIQNYKEIKSKLENLGASFIGETTFVDKYFNQPRGKVLKIIKDDKGSFVFQVRATDGKFELVRNERSNNPEETEKKFLSKYGIKKVLVGRRKDFQFENFKIQFNLIDNVGEFLILSGENPTKNVIEKKLGIQNPKYITVSFDML